MSCTTKIAAGSTPICPPASAGTAQRLVLFNFADKGAATVTGDGTISALSLASPAIGYDFEGIKLSNHPSYEVVVKPYQNFYKHTIEFLVFDATQAQKQNLENMVRGKMCAIVEYNAEGTAGELKYDVFGYGSGMFVKSLKRDPNDADNLGAFIITLETDEKALEGRMPQSLFNTSVATTKAIVDTILDL